MKVLTAGELIVIPLFLLFLMSFIGGHFISEDINNPISSTLTTSIPTTQTTWTTIPSTVDFYVGIMTFSIDNMPEIIGIIFWLLHLCIITGIAFFIRGIS